MSLSTFAYVQGQSQVKTNPSASIFLLEDINQFYGELVNACALNSIELSTLVINSCLMGPYRVSNLFGIFPWWNSYVLLKYDIPIHLDQLSKSLIVILIFLSFKLMRNLILLDCFRSMRTLYSQCTYKAHLFLYTWDYSWIEKICNSIMRFIISNFVRACDI